MRPYDRKGKLKRYVSRTIDFRIFRTRFRPTNLLQSTESFNKYYLQKETKNIHEAEKTNKRKQLFSTSARVNSDKTGENIIGNIVGWSNQNLKPTLQEAQ